MTRGEHIINCLVCSLQIVVEVRVVANFEENDR